MLVDVLRLDGFGSVSPAARYRDPPPEWLEPRLVNPYIRRIRVQKLRQCTAHPSLLVPAGIVPLGRRSYVRSMANEMMMSTVTEAMLPKAR